MTTLLAQHHHFPMDPSPFSAPASASSLPPSRAASSHSYNDDYFPPRDASRYGTPYHPAAQDVAARIGAPSALQISTAASAAQEHDPEEQTAHPSRMQSQLQRVKEPEMHDVPVVDADQQQLSQASGSASQHSSPSPPASRSGSVPAPFTTSFGSFDEGLSRPLTHKERELLAHLDRLKFFLATAPSRWSMDGTENPAGDPNGLPVGHPNSAHPALNRFLLPNSEYVSCVLWGGLYHITGTDIVRALVFRFEAFGRPVKNMKKFEEGVFSDLRNLKPGVDACLEEPKSPFLDLLFKYQCIRTQKKQKVFYWFSVPHDRLFLDALERDLKREKMGLEPTTVITGEPALSFSYDPKRSLYDQFSKAAGGVEGEGELEAAVRRADEAQSGDTDSDTADKDATNGVSDKHHSDADMSSSEADEPGKSSDIEASGASPSTSSTKLPKAKSSLHGPNSPFFSMFSLFEGSPTYKQRRKKIPKHRSPSALDGSPYGLPDGSPDYFGLPPNGMPTRSAEPQIDRYGRDTTRLSAADMFLAQARGDFGPQSNPDLIASQKERQRRAMQARAGQLAGKGYFGPGAPGFDGHAMRESPEAGVYPPQQPGMVSNGAIPGIEHEMGRPRVEQRHTYPMMALPADHPMRANTQQQQQYGAHWPAGAAGAESVAVPRTKAYVCPLFSCGRMFKRMEHLKRHLRTHTLERPYQCQQCKKRFSRSDHLNQHLRTHLRSSDGAPVAPEEDADVESEGVDDLEGDGEAYINGLGSIPDVQMCEVEIEGQIQEVQGDEEGLLMPAPSLTHSVSTSGSVDEAQEIYYPENPVEASPDPHHQYAHGSPNNWNMIRSHPSPAFSTISMPSPHMGPSSSSSAYSSVSDFISMSAPAHKASFDHASLYPSVTELNGAGPIRRHRSATPSMGRYETAARRPFTASGGAGSAPRTYHPYAAAVAHSADSSPMAYTVPLGYDGSPQMHVSLSRSSSHSRSSSTGQQLQEQMSQMLNLEHMEPEAFAHQAPASAQQQAYPGLYRTDSPMQFAGGAVAAAFDVDAEAPGVYPMALDEAQQQQQHHHHHHQFGAQAVVDPGYFSTMAHPVAL